MQPASNNDASGKALRALAPPPESKRSDGEIIARALSSIRPRSDDQACHRKPPGDERSSDLDTEEDLHAVEDIRNLVGRYCDALSHLDLQAVGECWTDDGIWTLFDEDIIGRAAILAAIRELTTRIDWIVQHANSPVIEVDGDTATGCWQIAEYARRKSGGAEGLVHIGRYLDCYVETEDGWRFAARCFETIHHGTLTTP